MKTFIREKKIYCGKNYMEVDIYNYTKIQGGNGRSKKKKESLPKQKNLNDKNARRKFVQLGEANFGKNDLSIHLTHKEELTLEDAEKEVHNYIERIKRRRKKEGVEPLKYMLVTAYGENEDGNMVRVHHHILMNKGLDRDVVEDLWRKRKRKGEKEGRPIGYANADRIQPDTITGIAGLLTYLVKNPTQKRRWTCSQNLTRPESRTNDFKYSRRRIIKIVQAPFDKQLWEKLYPGWEIRDTVYGYEQTYNDFTGWSIYIKLRKKE